MLLAVGITGLWGAQSGSLCRSAHASDTLPSDYCFQLDIAITNATGGAITDGTARVEINAQSLVNQGALDPRAWDMLPTRGSISNDINVLAQDLTDPDAAFWVQIDDLPDATTRTWRIYMGSGEQRRDQGIFYTGGDFVTVSDHADFDITDNLDVEISITNLSNTARDEFILDKVTGGAGYAVEFIDDGSVLDLRFTIDADTACQITWDTGWTDARQDFRFEYIAAAGVDATIYRNGSAISTCDLDEGAIGANASDVVIGSNVGDTSPLTDAIIHTAKISESSVAAGHWSFDARRMVETVATNPYGGTITDLSGNAHTGTYTFDRSQTGITYTLSALSVISGATTVTLTDEIRNNLGGGFGQNLSTPIATPAGSLFTRMIGNPVDSSGYTIAPRDFIWGMIFGAASILLVIFGKVFTNHTVITLFLGAVPMAIGMRYGYLPAWFFFLWALIIVLLWRAQRSGEQQPA